MTEQNLERYDVALAACADYERAHVEQALAQAITAIGGLDWVTPGMKIALKTNLVAAMRPEKAATSHPAVLSALTHMLRARGAEVVVGDSPGGIYNQAFVSRIYAVAGMKEVELAGAALNQDFCQLDVSFPAAKVLKHFTCTGYLQKVDAVIDVCKLKTHAAMGLSCGVKNLFGAIPGTMKPEFHYRYPDPAVFADMLVDISEYFQPRLTICDAIESMEGNGPTAGTPRRLGLLLASRSAHQLDLAAAHLVGFSAQDVPTLQAAVERGLVPATLDELTLFGDLDSFAVDDFQYANDGLSFFSGSDGGSITRRLKRRFLRAVFRSRPKAHADCVACGVCERLCPAKAIVIKQGIAKVNSRRCIRCFCCQEFCPTGAMRVQRSLLARIIGR